MLTSLPLSAIFIGNFCRNWVFAMVVTELPQYYADAYKIWWYFAAIGLVSAVALFIFRYVTNKIDNQNVDIKK